MLTARGRQRDSRPSRRRPALLTSPNDFTYATNAIRLSSETCPWKVGMMGLNPETTFGPRIQDRFTNVVLVGHDSAPVVQEHLLTENSHQVRTATLGIGAVAGGAAKLLEQLLAVSGKRTSSAGVSAEPSLIRRGLHHDDLADHARMLGSAILGAEQVIGACLGGVKPGLGEAPGQHIGLDTECGT